MHVTHLQRISLPVADQDRAKAFYVDTLGFELISDVPVPMGDNARWLEVAPHGSSSSMVLVTWLRMPPGSVDGLMLHTTDLAADVGVLQDAAVAVDGPFDTPWGRQATFTDPDGNGVVLVEAAADTA